MKKLMILGAAKNQIPIIKQSKKHGFYTIVVSIPGDYPGLNSADKVYYIDVTDKEQVLEVAKKEQVNGVVTDQLDLPIPTVAYVTEKLGLPSIGYDCALKFTNKYLMRNECTELGINNPEYYKVSTLDEAREKCLDIGFPIIIKPTDSAGSRGIHLINNITELEDKFEHSIALSRENCVLLEQHIKGTEYLVAGFASNYKFTNLMIGERELFDIPDTFVPRLNLFTSTTNNNHTENKILKLNKHLIEGFGLKFGITHSEYIVEDGTGNIYLLECAARGAANRISSDIIPLVSGIDANNLLLDIAVGNKQEIEVEIKESTTAVAHFFFSLPEGVIKDVRGLEEIKSLPNVHEMDLDSLRIGLKTKVTTDKGNRMGPILIKGNSKEQCRKTISEIQSLLEVDVETPEGIRGIIW